MHNIKLFIFLAGGVLALVARGKSNDPVALSHFRWQLRTFVIGFIWVSVAAALIIIGSLGVIVSAPGGLRAAMTNPAVRYILFPDLGVGVVLVIAAVPCIPYRIIRGFIALNRQTSMYALK